LIVAVAVAWEVALLLAAARCALAALARQCCAMLSRCCSYCCGSWALRSRGAGGAGTQSARVDAGERAPLVAPRARPWWPWQQARAGPRARKPSAAPLAAPEGFGSLEQAHWTLTAEQTRGRRVVLVGDVHGCAEELRELLDKVGFSATRGDLALFVGDLVAKGPDSAGVMSLVRGLGAAAMGVLGNHDHYVLAREYDELRPESEHARLARGGLDKADLRWLRGMPLTILVEEHNVIVAHAGLLPGTCREANSLENITTMRNVVQAPGGFTASSKPADGLAWAEVWDGPEHVVFGHDALRKLQRQPFATGLDTGCVYGGHLTALVLPGWTIEQVPARKTYKPPGA
jgi:bis(5'-nucleosyl)-tetraphosphatase (symmetrical)